MHKPPAPNPRLVELQTENEQLKSENETLKRENAELTETINRMKQSLDEAVRSSRPQLAPRRLKPSASQFQAASAIDNVYEKLTFEPRATSATADNDSELQRRLNETDEQLNRTVQQLNETRKQLSDVQSRLTVNEQVTAATQTRELLQEGIYQNLPTGSVYEELRFDPTQEPGHDYVKLQTHTEVHVLRSQYKHVAAKLDARTVTVRMYQRNALTLKELQSIQSLRDHPVAAAKTLLNIIMEQPDAVYLCFLDVLKHTDHQHVYQTLIERGYGVGQVIHTLPEDKPVMGVTSLGEHIYLLRVKEHDAVEVYDITTYRLVCCLTVPNARSFNDMTSCEHFLCLYISDPTADCIHRLDLQGNAKQWPVTDGNPCGLSVNADHNLIVTCAHVQKIKEFSPRGDLLRQFTVPNDIITPWHAIQLTSGQFIVCHGSRRLNDPIHRVCKIGADGGHIVQAHGGELGSDPDQYNWPCHLAVDNNEFVFVVDANNQRVALLSPALDFIRHVASSDQFKWRPGRLYLDVARRCQYVADNEFKDGKSITGRVVVFRV